MDELCKLLLFFIFMDGRQDNRNSWASTIAKFITNRAAGLSITAISRIHGGDDVPDDFKDQEAARSIILSAPPPVDFHNTIRLKGYSV